VSDGVDHRTVHALSVLLPPLERLTALSCSSTTMLNKFPASKPHLILTVQFLGRQSSRGSSVPLSTPRRTITGDFDIGNLFLFINEAPVSDGLLCSPVVSEIFRTPINQPCGLPLPLLLNDGPSMERISRPLPFLLFATTLITIFFPPS